MKTRTISAVKAINTVVSKKLVKLPTTLSRLFSSKVSLGDSITNFFFQNYELVIASTENEKAISYRTRHKVYCEEMKYERENASSQERDRYDDRSINCYIKHRRNGECAGTIRLVLPTFNNLKLPLEEKCNNAISDATLVPSNLSPETVCEISRLAIPREFRVKQVKSKVLSVEKLSEYKQKKNVPFNVEHFPYLSIALYLTATCVCMHLNVKQAYVLMEPKLARRMRTFGIHFKPVGDDIHFNGRRKPYRVSPSQLLVDLAKPLQRFYWGINSELSKTSNTMHSLHYDIMKSKSDGVARAA
ncbi:PEP-CTERM/exosortase system-associated acyltransferase [Alteromonas sp. V450]|uniref:PEP-CTERM/exosortase system-associated acyltransferase n=1 Tax=Alteromonas sp. V450 TaxID=1912139 RepID=UPI000A5BEE71|nr:PEP-CTERM/exosortase system-associated acyltransferase [Alteromonas sp. V450]